MPILAPTTDPGSRPPGLPNIADIVFLRCFWARATLPLSPPPALCLIFCLTLLLCVCLCLPWACAPPGGGRGGQIVPDGSIVASTLQLSRETQVRHD